MASPKAKEKAVVDSAALLRTIRDKFHDSSKGDMSYIEGDAQSERFTSPKLYYSTGLELVDTILGNGGFGSGRIVEIFGPNKTGKTELAHKTLETFINTYPTGIAFYWDQEMAVDDKKKALIPAFRSGRISWEWAPTAERLFGKMISMCNMIAESSPDTPILLIIDSLAALETMSESKAAVDKKSVMGPLAAVMSRVLKKIRPMLANTSATLIVINQIRHKAPEAGQGFGGGPDEESPGGEALKFWADYRIKTSAAGNFFYKPPKNDDDNPGPPDGFKCRFRTLKNKLAPPLRNVVLPLAFAPRFGCPSGLSDVWSVFMQFNAAKVMTARGGRYYLKDAEGKQVGEPFLRTDWPRIWMNPETKALAQPLLDRWKDALMLRSEESIEDVEDTDE